MHRILTLTLSLLLIGSSLPAFAGDTEPGERFQQVDESVLLDTHTGLMWAASDNGADVDWWEADSYCKKYSAGGHTDWRLPDIKELATLYTDKKNPGGFAISEKFTLTDCCLWSSYDVVGGALALSFRSGKKIPSSFPETYQMRVLPVRGKSTADLGNLKNF